MLHATLLETIGELKGACALLDQIASLPATPPLRREQIRLQVTLITPIMQVKGYAAPETKAAVSRARLLIDQSEALGEPLDDPLLLFSVLYGFWVANYVAFNGGVMLGLATDFLVQAEKQGATVPLIVGHRLMGTSLVCSGEMPEARAHLDRAVALYNPIEHRPLALRFGQDVRVAILSYRAMALWMLGYPRAALTDAEQTLADAREIDQAATLMYALAHVIWIYLWRGNYEEVSASRRASLRLPRKKEECFGRQAEWQPGAAYWYLLVLRRRRGSRSPMSWRRANRSRLQPDQDQARPARRTSLRHGRSTLIWINDAVGATADSQPPPPRRSRRSDVGLFFALEVPGEAYEHTFHNLQ